MCKSRWAQQWQRAAERSDGTHAALCSCCSPVGIRGVHVAGPLLLHHGVSRCCCSTVTLAQWQPLPAAGAGGGGSGGGGGRLELGSTGSASVGAATCPQRWLLQRPAWRAAGASRPAPRLPLHRWGPLSLLRTCSRARTPAGSTSALQGLPPGLADRLHAPACATGPLRRPDRTDNWAGRWINTHAAARRVLMSRQGRCCHRWVAARRNRCQPSLCTPHASQRQLACGWLTDLLKHHIDGRASRERERKEWRK